MIKPSPFWNKLRETRYAFYLGKYGTRGIWIVLITLLGTGLVTEYFFEWARNHEVFQRMGALCTALFVPWFALAFGQLSKWRAYQYSESTMIETKKIFAIFLEHYAKKLGGLDQSEKIDKLLKLNEHVTDNENLVDTLDGMEPRAMRTHAIALFVSTCVWGFGDLVFCATCEVTR